MSERAEDAALKAYPDNGSDNWMVAPFFQEGYEQAEKDILPAAKALVDAVERYAMGKCLRSELLIKMNELKKLIGE